MNNDKQVKIVGHRGYPKHYPENTLPGLKAALELGVDAVEFDVQLSQDGVPVVFHDITLDRTSTQSGSLLSLDFNSLHKISCHYPEKFQQQFYPLPIASLEQVVKALYHYEAEWFVEIKRQSLSLLGRQEFLKRVLNASEILGEQRRVISFDYEVIELAREISGLPVGWCLREFSQAEYQRARHLAPDFLIVRAGLAGDGELWPGPWSWFIYDINTREEALHWHRRGAAYIETDDPKNVL